MEIASHLFPTEHRFKLNRVGYNRIDFSEISSQSYSNRKEEKRYNLMSVSKKRNKLPEEEEETPNKRQKRIIEHDLASKAKSHGTSPKSKITKPEKSMMLSRIRLHHVTKTEAKVITKPIDEEIEKQGRCSLRDLIAKAKNKVEEKRQIDGRTEYIARKRLEARLAINRVDTTAAADDHLKYHRELEQLGCTFIHDQVICWTKFILRSEYIDESTTFGLEDTESVRSDGERKHGSAESTNRAKDS